MTHKPTFSFILATVGRKESIAVLLQTLVDQTYPIDKFEILIIDQNKNCLIDEIVVRYQKHLNIIHIKSAVLGLSINRNIGLEKCTGDIICFPDDDCEYPIFLVEKVAQLFAIGDIDFLLGKIWDKNKNIPAIRKWPERNIKINRINFYRLTSSITLFTTNKTQRFDERFGLGTSYGSNEDVIYIYSLLARGNTGAYFPEVTVYHEHQAIESLSRAKVASYAKGFGRFVWEYKSFSIFVIFIISITFQALAFIRSVLIFDWQSASLRITSLKWRIFGLFKK
jgi:glycosyltransferase involved in cell wall biosynthesis